MGPKAATKTKLCSDFRIRKEVRISRT
jgi:hypothetical protein